jgi:predicted MFS family arabinose efflux permease
MNDINDIYSAPGGPSLFIDLLIVIYGIAGYFFAAFNNKAKPRKSPSASLVFLFVATIILGMLFSAYGMGAFMFIFASFAGGFAIRAWSDRRA